MKFEELDLDYDVLDGIEAMNFVECTPIQEQAIPIILEGRDLLASAQTGTGKTAAYLLPLLHKLVQGGHAEHKVNAMIILPTRELAQQVDQLLEGFAYYTDISWIAVYGGNDGAAFAQQKRAIEMGGDIVVATPGRLLSHMRMGSIDFSGINYLILDEADRMLDIGFYDDIMEIISHLPSHRQTVMFSATFPPDVEKLAKKVLVDPAEVKISVSKPAEGITQAIYLLHEQQKNPLILSLLQQRQGGKAIIFSSSKDKVRLLYQQLRRLKLSVAQMHSGLEQVERTQVMLDFKNGKINALVATDVVSRGIDIDDIDLVINYDVPFQPEDYVHRVGRTARAGATGLALTLVTPDDRFRYDKIERFIERALPRYVMPEEVAKLADPVEDVPASRQQRGGGGFKRNSKGGKFSTGKSSTSSQGSGDKTNKKSRYKRPNTKPRQQESNS